MTLLDPPLNIAPEASWSVSLSRPLSLSSGRGKNGSLEHSRFALLTSPALRNVLSGLRVLVQGGGNAALGNETQSRQLPAENAKASRKQPRKKLAIHAESDGCNVSGVSAFKVQCCISPIHNHLYPRRNYTKNVSSSGALSITFIIYI